MENRKIKIICVCALILIAVLMCFGVSKWTQAKMIESVQNHAEAAGLKNVSIELSEYDKGELFVRCSNFQSMEWDALFSMHKELMDIWGVEEITYVRRFGQSWRHYVINVDENMIESYNGDGHIDYYGSWTESQESSYISSSAIQKDLENRKNNSGDSSADNSSSNSSDNETDAKVCAVKAVKDSLKSPSTAEFCKYTEMTATNLGGNKWKITGYVDAQNSFGATLREYWTVTLTLTGNGYKDASVTFS